MRTHTYRRPSKAAALALGLSLALIAPRALADFAPVQYPAACAKAESPDQSRAAFVRGKAASDRGDYDVAIKDLTEAYRLDCTRHTFLQLISTTLEKQARYDEAIRALQLLLERASDLSPTDRSNTEAKIKNLGELRERQRRAASPQIVKVEAKPKVVVVREHTLAPWIVTGIGVAAVAAGVVLHVAAPALPAGCDPNATNVDGTKGACIRGTLSDTDHRDRLAKAGLSQDMPLAGTISLIGGGVLVAGGLLWHFLEPTGPVTKDAAGAPRLTPLLGQSTGGLSLSGAF